MIVETTMNDNITNVSVPSNGTQESTMTTEHIVTLTLVFVSVTVCVLFASVLGIIDLVVYALEQLAFVKFIYLFYLGFYVSFNTVQVISRWVVGRAEETSTYSWSRFCTVNCKV